MALKTAVVTGANKGLGLELCKQLAADDRFGLIYAICRKSSEGLTALASDSVQKVSVVEGIDVMNTDISTTLKSTFQGKNGKIIPIDLLIQNAGGYGPPMKETESYDELYRSQTLETVNADRMLYSYQLNTIAPLLVTQALLPNLLLAANTNNAVDGVPTKVIIMSSLMGSIGDNDTGGHYGYRAAKAAVNQVGKSMSTDLKQSGIAVGMIHPGFVYTDFGGSNAPRRPGQRDVDESVRGVLQAVDQVTLENTGCFLHGNYGEGVKSIKW